jgi:DNA-binding response OmpR family regulator
MSEDVIIVAEQDWNLRNVLRQHLDGLGYRTLVTPIAGEAEDFARRVLARLVLLDVELPGYSGYEACARIRRMVGYGGVPIVLMTAASSTRRHLAGQRAGASAMLLKPFSMNDLKREVDRLLLDPDTLPHPAPAPDHLVPGFADAPVRVWQPSAELTWRFGEGSGLSAGRRALEMMRLTGRRDA